MDKRKSRRDLVVNYRKTLDMNFSILQETLVNVFHLHNIRELWDGEVIIPSAKTKRTDPPIEQKITDSS